MGTVIAALGGKLLELILPSLATAIAGLIAAILTRKLKQLGLELDAQQANKLTGIVGDAIRAAEEAAHRSPNMTSTAKRDLATAIIQEKEPTLDKSTIGMAIDATLPKVRLELVQTTHGPAAVVVPMLSPAASDLTSRAVVR